MKRLIESSLILYGLFLFAALLLTGCSVLKLEPADFQWPIESVLTADQNGVIFDERYTFSFPVKQLFIEEQIPGSVSGAKIHLIRNSEGYYFLIAEGFKNVYVLRQGMKSLDLENKIKLGETGITDPAFNQRSPYIELLNDKNQSFMLTREGVR